MREIALRGHEAAAGFLVQAMDDPWTLFASDAGKRLAMMQQRIDQRAGLVPRRGMHHEPGRLVDHDQVFVLVQHPKRDFLRLGQRGNRRRFAKNNRVAIAQTDARLDRQPVQFHALP